MYPTAFWQFTRRWWLVFGLGLGIIWPAEPPPVFQAELSRLIQISQRLYTRNTWLESEFKTLQTVSSTLSNLLQTSELQLGESEQTILKLSGQLEYSQAELTNAWMYSQRTEQTLTNLQTSFTAYKNEVRKELLIWKGATALAVVAAVLLPILTR